MDEQPAAYTGHHLDELLRTRTGLTPTDRAAALAVATVYPFRVNGHVVDELIEWSAAPDDPIFRLTFPQPSMLAPADLQRVMRLRADGARPTDIADAVAEIRERLNPHPAGQLTDNEPTLDGVPLPGLQHKYAETLLVLPREGQTCHAYCTYCFRWPQFVGEPDLRSATNDVEGMVAYLRRHPEITDVLITGGDPFVMSAAVLRRYVDALLTVDTVEVIRLGTKALVYQPQRFLGAADASDLMDLLRSVVASGRLLAVMAHVSHPVELRPEVTQRAIARLRETGAVIRCQAPIIRGVNDDAETWATMWRTEVRLGLVPYYMFIARDTGPQDFFGVPLARAYEVYRDAIARVGGLARTARGPVASSGPGKITIDGIANIGGADVFVLRYLQARDPARVGRPFFAHYDPDTIWIEDLKPAPF